MKNKIEWPVALFLVLNPLFAAIVLPVYLYHFGFQWSLFLMGIAFAAATNLSITAGYHRHFSHKSYDAHPIAQFFFLLIGASAFQGSALKWSSDHRRHHGNIDTEHDPYNINEGFWHAHMGWLFLKKTVAQEIQAPDLQKNRMVAFQDRHYVWIAILTGFGIPTLIGALLGSPLGGLLVGGSLRIFLTQQSTFFVNSLCHTLGKQTYSKEISARDSWFVAILTHGEGYHNFHHKFQIDYRNGIRWYHWDPTKWTILSLKMMGLAHRLRTISNVEILKARLQVEESQLKLKGHADDKIHQIKERILAAQMDMKKLTDDFNQKKLEFKKSQSLAYANTKLAYDRILKELQTDIKLRQLEFEAGLKQWKLLLEM